MILDLAEFVLAAATTMTPRISRSARRLAAIIRLGTFIVIGIAGRIMVALGTNVTRISERMEKKYWEKRTGKTTYE